MTQAHRSNTPLSEVSRLAVHAMAALPENVNCLKNPETGIWTLCITDFESHMPAYLNALRTGLLQEFQLTADPDLAEPRLTVVRASFAPENAKLAPIYAVDRDFRFAAAHMERSQKGGFISRGRGCEAYAEPIAAIK